MQNALEQINQMKKSLKRHNVSIPPRCYFIYKSKDGKKIYIPILEAATYRSRLSRKMFKRAQAAQDYALKFHKRYIRMKAASQ